MRLFEIDHTQWLRADHTKELHKAIKLIKRDCQPFLSQVDKPFSLVRGLSMSYNKGLFIKKQIRLDDRQPREMTQYRHDAINKYFTEKFGVPFRNAMFANGNEDEDIGFNIFGAPWHVFPIGDFKFLWSSGVDDMNYHTGRWIADSLGDPEDEAIIAGIERSNYRTTDLQGAIWSHNEIMIRGSEYYGIPAGLNADYNLNDLIK